GGVVVDGSSDGVGRMWCTTAVEVFRWRGGRAAVGDDDDGGSGCCHDARVVDRGVVGSGGGDSGGGSGVTRWWWSVKESGVGDREVRKLFEVPRKTRRKNLRQRRRRLAAGGGRLVDEGRENVGCVCII
nr:hypothetical protein [Tanacetum cinerariifolium]